MFRFQKSGLEVDAAVAPDHPVKTDALVRLDAPLEADVQVESDASVGSEAPVKPDVSVESDGSVGSDDLDDSTGASNLHWLRHETVYQPPLLPRTIAQ